jgi:signal transduction histidine kinase
VAIQRAESFLLEWLSPFEMTHRGACEANQALRRLDERREEEVRRIARELHDQVSQLLATAHVALEGVRPHLAPGGESGLERVAGTLRDAGDEIRRLSHELRPIILDDLGLAPALRFLGKGVAQRSGLVVTVMGSSDGRLPPAIEVAIYRAAQEALSNVVRHARASCATLELERTELEVRCRVVDDGCGFEPDTVLAPGARCGIGLDCIRERIAPLGGRLDISSRPGHGTGLLITIPLEIAHAHSPAHRG